MLSPLVYGKSNNRNERRYTVTDTYRSLEEKVNLLNIEVIAMKSFIEDQMLILMHSRKDSTLQKSPCDYNSEIAGLTKKIAYLHNENGTNRYYLKMIKHSKSLSHLIRVS